MPYILRPKDFNLEIVCQSADELRVAMELFSGGKNRLPSSDVAARASKNGGTTLKEHVIEVLREQPQHRFLKAREIWDLLKVRNVRINSTKQPDIIANTVRSSINRNQGIFEKRGSKIGLAEWKGSGYADDKVGR